VTQKTRAEAAADLHELARKIEAGEVDQVFAISLKEHGDNYSIESQLHDATSIGAAYAIEEIAEQIQCCGGCFPGQIKAAVVALFAKSRQLTGEKAN
jgi:hypothetical protein